MGTLLVNERMLETYIYARDHFLRPGGKMFPVRVAARVLHCCTLCAHTTTNSAQRMWQQNDRSSSCRRRCHRDAASWTHPLEKKKPGSHKGNPL